MLTMKRIRAICVRVTSKLCHELIKTVVNRASGSGATHRVLFIIVQRYISEFTLRYKRYKPAVIVHKYLFTPVDKRYITRQRSQRLSEHQSARA